MSESGGTLVAPVAPSSSAQSDHRMNTGVLLDSLSFLPESSGPAAVWSHAQSTLGHQEQSDARQEDPNGSTKVVHIVMDNTYSSTPPMFPPAAPTRPGSLSTSSPSSIGENEDVPEVDVYDDSPPPVTATTSRPVLLHPSLLHVQPRATKGSPVEEESSGESEIYEISEESEPEVVVPPPKKRKPTTILTPSDRPSKRARLPRETKISAIEKIRRIPTPPPTRRPTAAAVQVPKPKPKPKPRSPSPPKKPDPTSKPGYPYWGAEHSANPPPLVSTPIERREIGLHTLVDPPPGERPQYNYTTLIKHAILGSPDKKLTIDGIYEQIMGRFEYFRDKNGKSNKGWKNSVRHQMSLSACFEKKERLLWESGKGVWWVVNEAVEGGTKRERKRNPRNKAAKEAKALLQAATANEVILAPALPVSRGNIEHPIFPRALAPDLPPRGTVVSGSHLFTPQPQSSQQAPESRSSLAPVQRPVFKPPFLNRSFTPPHAPRVAQPDVSDAENSRSSSQMSTSPRATARNRPAFGANLAAPSTGIPFSQLTSANTGPGVFSRLASSRAADKHRVSGPKNVIHTRWQSSADLHFDADPRDSDDDETTDSEEEDGGW